MNNTTRIIDTSMHRIDIATFAQHKRVQHPLVKLGINHSEPDQSDAIELYNLRLRDNIKRISNYEAKIILTEIDSDNDNIEHIFMCYQLTWATPNFRVLLSDQDDNTSALLILTELPAELQKINKEHNIDLIAFIKIKFPNFKVPNHHHLELALCGGIILLSDILINEIKRDV